MDFWLVAYILLSIVIGVSLYGFLYNRGQNTAAMIVFVLLIAVFAFFGLRWFQKGVLKGSVADPSGNWPPIVNLCPDFMVAWKDPSGGKVYCHDANNIYNLKTASSLTAPLTNSGTTNPIGGVTNGAGFLIFDASASGNPTSLKDTGGPAKFPFLNTLYSSTNTVSGNTSSDIKSIRWEGVWDGQKSTALNAPLYKA